MYRERCGAQCGVGAVYTESNVVCVAVGPKSVHRVAVLSWWALVLCAQRCGVVCTDPWCALECLVCTDPRCAQRYVLCAQRCARAAV